MLIIIIYSGQLGLSLFTLPSALNKNSNTLQGHLHLRSHLDCFGKKTKLRQQAYFEHTLWKPPAQERKRTFFLKVYFTHTVWILTKNN